MTNSQVLESSGERYLTPGKAAAMLGVSTTTLAAYADTGAIEFIRLPASGHRRYRESSVIAFRDGATPRRSA